MSIASRQPVQIFIKWGEAKGKKKVQAALHQAIINALSDAVDDTETYMKEIVPESKKRDPPYPPSYKSEALMTTAIHVLTDSLAAMETGGLKHRYYLKYGYPASYAQKINLKRNVRKWSKPGSKTGFFGKAKQKLIRRMRVHLKDYLSKEAAVKTDAKKYLGKVRTG